MSGGCRGESRGELLPEYEAMLKTGAFGGGTDSTIGLSEERNARCSVATLTTNTPSPPRMPSAPSPLKYPHDQRLVTPRLADWPATFTAIANCRKQFSRLPGWVIGGKFCPWKRLTQD